MHTAHIRSARASRAVWYAQTTTYAGGRRFSRVIGRPPASACLLLAGPTAPAGGRYRSQRMRRRRLVAEVVLGPRVAPRRRHSSLFEPHQLAHCASAREVLAAAAAVRMAGGRHPSRRESRRLHVAWAVQVGGAQAPPALPPRRPPPWPLGALAASTMTSDRKLASGERRRRRGTAPCRDGAAGMMCLRLARCRRRPLDACPQTDLLVQMRRLLHAQAPHRRPVKVVRRLRAPETGGANDMQVQRRAQARTVRGAFCSESEQDRSDARVAKLKERVRSN